MSKKTIITCACHLEIDNVNEYEALDIVNEMLKREYPLSEKTILRIIQPMYMLQYLKCLQTELVTV